MEEEDKLHNDILAYCKTKGWLPFHGSMAHRSRRTLGEPDFHILMDNGRHLMVECKDKNGKLSADQRNVIAWATKLGHTIYVVRSMDEFLEVSGEQGQLI